MRLDNPDNNVDAFGEGSLRGQEHGIGLTHTGAGAEIDAQLATPSTAFIALHAGKELVRIGTVRSVWGWHHVSREQENALILGRRHIQSQIQIQYVYRRFPEKAELPSHDVL